MVAVVQSGNQQQRLDRNHVKCNRRYDGVGGGVQRICEDEKLCPWLDTMGVVWMDEMTNKTNIGLMVMEPARKKINAIYLHLMSSMHIENRHKKDFKFDSVI